MFQKKYISVVLSVIISNIALAINTYTPKNLEFLSTANVSGCIQDSRGAIWLNSNRGFYRFNGQSAEYFRPQIGQTKVICDEAGHIYGLDGNQVFVFDDKTLNEYRIVLEEDMSNAVIAAMDSSLFIGHHNRLYKLSGHHYSLFRSFGNDISIKALAADISGRLLIGTNKQGLITADGETIIDGIGSIRSIHTTNSGVLLIGTRKNGLYRINGRMTDIIGQGTLFDIRSVIEGNDGHILIGTADGLYSYSNDGSLTKESIDGITSCPICNITKDADGDIWISTYYNGILISEYGSNTFQRIESVKEIQNIRGLTKDYSNNVYIATDGNGIWSLNTTNERFRKIDATDGYKFQCVWYDSVCDALWAADYHGQIMNINPVNGAKRTYKVIGRNGDISENILSIRRKDDLLYLAGLQGIYIFNPIEETEIRRRVHGLDKRVFDMEIAGNGSIFAASYGIFKIDNGHAEQIDMGVRTWYNNSTIQDIDIDNDGRIWAAYFRRGVVYMGVEGTEAFNKESCGLIDDFCYNVIPIGDGKAIVSTGREISEISDEGSTLRFPTDKINRLIKLDDGRIMAASNDGITIISPDKISAGKGHGICIDKFSINGQRFNNRILSPDQTGFSFEVTSFDYSETEARAYFCRLKGFENEWRSFDIKQPVNFMNMKPGKYTFEVEARNFKSETLASDSYDFCIKPHWWATPLSTILFSLLFLSAFGVTLHYLYIKRRLTEQIRQKEKENKEKTIFFINLSYQLRTPLNLAIGNLEHFFNKYGARTAGIESIEDVYNKAVEMRNLISNYVDTSNDHTENSADTPVTKNSKFLNAAIGVVERNLFSQDLNVGLLCKELNMGKTSLTKRIVDASGMTPRVFIEDIKLKYAAQLLADGTYRVGEVADLLNFSSQKYFSQRFKIQYGVTPNHYVKKS